MQSETINSTTEMGFAQKLSASLLAPKRLYQQIAEQSSKHWIIFALIALVLVTLPVIIGGPIQREQALASFEAARGDFEIPEGGVDPAQFIANPITTTVIPAVFSAVGVAVGWLIWSGALHLISSLTGGRNTFLQMLRLVIWSWVPYGLRAILQTIYIATTQTLITNPGLSGLVDTGISPETPFVTPSAGTLALQAFLQQIELYPFWRLALLIIGVTIIAQIPRRKAVAAVVVIWIIFVLIRVGAAAAAGGITGALAG